MDLTPEDQIRIIQNYPELRADVEMFNYELCYICEKDLDWHYIGVGPFGEPRLMCYKEVE